MRETNISMKDEAIDLLNGIITDQTTKAELEAIKYLKRLIKADMGVKTPNENNITEKEVEEFFNKTYEIYPRKISKVKARSVYMKKIMGLPKEKAREKALKIYKMLVRQVELWQKENSGVGRAIEFIPHFASWLNANVS